MVKSNFDDFGVVRKLRTRTKTFILGVWGHVAEKVIEKLGFLKNPGPRRGRKFKEMALAKNFVPKNFSNLL
jgi:hypothetical protein